jgi:hypothetical protein
MNGATTMQYRKLINKIFISFSLIFGSLTVAQSTMAQISDEEFQAGIAEIKSALPINVDEYTVWIDIYTNGQTIHNLYDVYASTEVLLAAASEIEKSVLDELCSSGNYAPFHELADFKAVFEYKPDDSDYVELRFEYDKNTCG